MRPQNSTRTTNGYLYFYGDITAEYVRMEAGNPKPYPGVRWYVEIRHDGAYIRSEHFRTLHEAESYVASIVRRVAVSQ